MGFNLQPSKVMYRAIIRHILHRKPSSRGEAGKEEGRDKARGSPSPSLSRAVSELSKHRLDELALTCLMEEAFKLRYDSAGSGGFQRLCPCREDNGPHVTVS